MGASPHALVQAKRIMEAKRLLSQTKLDIVDVAYSSGFNSLRQFNDVFKQVTHETPRVFRKTHTLIAVAHSNPVDITIRIPFKKPLAWLPLKNALLAHMIPGLEVVNETSQTLTRLLKINGRYAKLVLDLSEPNDVVRATLSIINMEDVSEAVQTIKRVLDLDSDPAHITAAFQDDSLIGPLNKRLPGLRVCGMFDPFELLINTIIGQQVSIPAARTFSERLVKAYGEQHDGLYLFPTAKTLLNVDAFEMYQKTKINHKKVATIQAVCRLIAEGFDLKSITKSEVARQKLLAVKGIGPWTVEYVILRGFGDADGFPADDLFIKRLLEVKTAKAAEAKAEKWRPYRGYATMYLWTKGTYE